MSSILVLKKSSQMSNTKRRYDWSQIRTLWLLEKDWAIAYMEKSAQW